jgi:hypothetical protein
LAAKARLIVVTGARTENFASAPGRYGVEIGERFADVNAEIFSRQRPGVKAWVPLEQ